MCLSLVLVMASVSAPNLAMQSLAVELGALGDPIGRRKVLIAGNAVFGAAAVFTTCSSSTSHLIVGRVVMGSARP
ncbi:MFS transporter [Streptomyces sp. NPDC001436]